MKKVLCLLLFLLILPQLVNAETYEDDKYRFSFETPPGWTIGPKTEDWDVWLIKDPESYTPPQITFAALSVLPDKYFDSSWTLANMDKKHRKDFLELCRTSFTKAWPDCSVLLAKYSVFAGNTALVISASGYLGGDNVLIRQAYFLKNSTVYIWQYMSAHEGYAADFFKILSSFKLS
jgi:hypothetical protein